MKLIVLASKSPRRKALLKQLGLKFKVVPSELAENLNPRLKPRKQAEVLSLQKAKAVLSKAREGIIIAADTLISLDNDILIKPKDLQDAKKMLKKLSGKVHSVFTGFTIIDISSKKTVIRSVETKVWLKRLTNREINNYIEKETPIGFAGSYRIQGYGSVIVEKIEGDFFNVVGLPLNALAIELRKFGVEIL